MQVDELVSKLGYSSSPNWITEPALTDHLFRRAKKAKVHGAYCLRISPDDPDSPALPPRHIVYLAYADTVEDAREIHRRLWNLGSAPFLIVKLPHQVRIYKGFRFERGDERGDLISEAPWGSVELEQALKCFHAHEIDTGRIWQTQAEHLMLDTRVDRHLLGNLNTLGDELVSRLCMARGPRNTDDEHVKELAHALIGKYIYIRYLRDRGILDDEWLDRNGLDLSAALGRAATLHGLLALIEALERKFNGRIFPFPDTTDDLLDDTIIRYVASVFGGDDATSGQQRLDFGVYLFSYIPVVMLSLIYEQFLHRTGKARSAGAYYTPVPLADYLLAELNHEKPLALGMTVLDPCCGSGVFLVLTYRMLVDLAMQDKRRKLTGDELKGILLESIYGVERNEDACRVTEFSLILTLLSYLDPPDLQHNEHFKFPILRDNNLFACDLFEEGSAFSRKRLEFDWIVGNPPWKKLSDKEPDDTLALNWVAAHEQEYPVPFRQLCCAFTWRVRELVRSQGRIGLVLPATILTNVKSVGYRRRFFKQHDVRRITNFSNFAYILFDDRAEEPAATVVYGPATTQDETHAIVHYGPFVINQMQTRCIHKRARKAWMITVCEDEITTVPNEEAERGETQTWKLALWGTYQDRRVISQLRRLMPDRLGEVVKKRKGWALEKGLQWRNIDKHLAKKGKPEDLVPIPQLRDIPLLDARAMYRSGLRLTVPSDVLGYLAEEDRYVRRRSGLAGLKIASAPHLFLTANFAAFSTDSFVLPHARIGLCAPEEDEDYLRALSVILNSSIARFLLFFEGSTWGVDRSIVHKADVENLAVPMLSDTQVQQLAKVHRQLSQKELGQDQVSLFGSGEITRVKVPKDVREELDDMIDAAVERVFDVPEYLGVAAREFFRVRYGVLKGDVGGIASTPPRDEHLRAYASRLARALDGFSGVAHKVGIHWEGDFIACTVDVAGGGDLLRPSIVLGAQASRNRPGELWDMLREQNSQWVYIQRGLRVFDGPRVHLWKSARRIDWTQTQALLDAGDIIAEVLAHQDMIGQGASD